MSELNQQVNSQLRQITILYFDILSKRLELESETINLPPEVATIRDLIPWLMTRRGEWQRALSGSLDIMLNYTPVEQAVRLHNGDEISLALMDEKTDRK